MRNFKLFSEQDDPDTSGNSRHGTFESTPAEVVAAFPNPTSNEASSDGKVDREYIFGDEKGNFFTLYAYCMTSTYDEEYPTPEQFWKGTSRIRFSIGSKSNTENFGEWLTSKIPTGVYSRD